MAHRVFRLSIRPARAPEVRRVVDFDGRSTLHDVHSTLQQVLELDDDHLYAFYLSGKYFDSASEYGISKTSRHDAKQARLFRLGLRPGQQVAYLFDFGDELRHSVEVVSITDTDAALETPALVESVGDAPSQYGDEEEDDPSEPYALPEHLTDVAPLAETVLVLSERLDTLYEEDDAKHEASLEGDDASTREEGPPEAIVSLLRELAPAALALAASLEEDEDAVFELDEWSGERELLPRLVELPLALVNVSEHESALAVARAFNFVAPESFNADLAIILADAGRRDEAVAQLQSNLKQSPGSCLTAMKSGEAYEALGDPTAAEASYRRGISLAEDSTEREEALSQLSGFLQDTGRADEIESLRSSRVRSERASVAKSLPVGRNEPCPCGSGQKYKKCHGATT